MTFVTIICCKSVRSLLLLLLLKLLTLGFSLSHYGLIHSKDGAQNIVRNVFHNELCENVEYENQGFSDYVVFGQYQIFLLDKLVQVCGYRWMDGHEFAT